VYPGGLGLCGGGGGEWSGVCLGIHRWGEVRLPSLLLGQFLAALLALLGRREV